MTNRKGFTLIELLIVVVIIGILAAIAIPKFANTKQKAQVSALKSDLRNLATAQEAYFADFNTYAPAIGATQSAGVAAFSVSPGNSAPTIVANATGWSATITNAALAGATPSTCGIYFGTAASPNAAVTVEGAVGCW
jgi:prepilin-type N-terminal cleavage/methylation domain-containing protein